ncbi:MAG: type IV secretory system conjugative DNA transfer family protein, partial [Clostridia bacterium]|nr:type IV secretory system conjugative DNA transfer family protein [Clostridia bacterium]
MNTTDMKGLFPAENRTEDRVMRRQDWAWYNRFAEMEPNREHTVLRSVEDLSKDPDVCVYDFGTTAPSDAHGRTMASYRDAHGKLKIAKYRKHFHELVIGSSGRGKTQGRVATEIFNMDGRTSYILTDPKGELTKIGYDAAVKLYGKENVHIANFMQPECSTVRMNLFADMAKRWLAAERKSASSKRLIRDQIATDVRKFIDEAFPVESERDPSWERTAKSFIYAILIALFEDLTLTPEQEKKLNRRKTLPHQINFHTVSNIFYTFSWGSRMDDHGFLSKRAPASLAYRNSKSVLNNASNTRANYLGFVEGYLKQVSDPKITAMTQDNTFDILSMAHTPKVLFLVYDQGDVAVREWVNILLANSLQALFEYSTKTMQPLPVPIVTMFDEFPTLRPNEVYPKILSTGRGANLFMIMIVQSLSQLKARYPKDYNAMVENCAIRSFLGTNDVQTAIDFSENMGKKNVPDPTMYLKGE